MKPERKDKEKVKEKKIITYDNTVINQENLLVCDSNGKAIDTSRIHRTEKVICYVLDDVARFLDGVTKEKEPKRIILHVGTNELDIGVNKASVLDKYTRTINALKSKFNNSKLFVALILPRKGKKGDEINRFIKEFKVDLETLCNKLNVASMNN